MNTRQEIVDVFDGHPGDRPPPAVFTQTGTVGQMGACGSHWPEANYDSGAMAELSLQFSRMFGFATVRVPFCITAEAERLGATVSRGTGDSQPSVVRSPYADAAGIQSPPDDMMTPDEFVSGGRVAVIADVAERISREHGDLFVTAGMVDPVALVFRMVGVENALMAHILDPPSVKEWVRRMTPYEVAYARRLAEAADNVMVIASAFTDIIDPDMYRDMVEPSLAQQVASIRGAYRTIHSCGDTLARADSLARIGADALSLETSPAPEAYLERVAGRCLMVGSVDPVGTLLRGSPADVASDARRWEGLGFDIIAPECGIVPHTPDGNLRALAEYRGRVWAPW